MANNCFLTISIDSSDSEKLLSLMIGKGWFKHDDDILATLDDVQDAYLEIGPLYTWYEADRGVWIDDRGIVIVGGSKWDFSAEGVGEQIQNLCEENGITFIRLSIKATEEADQYVKAYSFPTPDWFKSLIPSHAGCYALCKDLSFLEDEVDENENERVSSDIAEELINALEQGVYPDNCQYSFEIWSDDESFDDCRIESADDMEELAKTYLCPNCGSYVQVGWTECDECGEKLPDGDK